MSVEIDCHTLTYYSSKAHRSGDGWKPRNELVWAVKNCRPATVAGENVDAFDRAADQLWTHFHDALHHATIIPIPRSSTAATQMEWGALRLARRIVDLGAGRSSTGRVAEAIRRTTSVTPSSAGGVRSVDTQRSSLTAISTIVAGLQDRVLLLDDLVTSGCHLIAATALLRDAGYLGAVEAATVAYTTSPPAIGEEDFASWRFTWDGSSARPGRIKLSGGPMPGHSAGATVC